MRRIWTASVFCWCDQQLAVARHKVTGQWEPLSVEVTSGESPLIAATRAVQENLGVSVSFHQIHQLHGAPEGLVLYSEYPISPNDVRMSLVFLGSVETKGSIAGNYDEILWVSSDSELPWATLPQVRSAYTYAEMAANTVYGSR